MSKSTQRIIKEKQGQFKPIVYICAPFSGDTTFNTNQAIQYAKFAYEKGAIPLTPHLLFPFLDDASLADRQSALFMDKILLGKCQEVWVFGETITNGMNGELEISKKRRQLIRYFSTECVEVEKCN
ncbi:hypothetical protein GMA11_02560 [Granulicatella sp. zg-ZJ]|uniref:DUF7768 domain-containing protein n=1 Tax=Granulicatella sp. zg-ZJ TaxID=2678504 RepID=UPI0013D1A284|nr:DUF4406 domain-containing protein [Granulicatella sp. zg-ZJ]NEW62269.1 hypothetical protein [Granulicatella sp. zg-ZJ]